MFIAIEGCDGVGKQTQTERLRQACKARGLNPKVYSFPRYETELGALMSAHLRGNVALQITGSTFTCDVARANKLMFQCLATADKYTAAQEIRQDLVEGRTVIVDRWWQSAYAYGISDGIDPVWLLQLSANLPQADFNFLLETPYEIVRKRKPIPDDHYEADAKKQVEVAGLYRNLWRRNAKTANAVWRIIDTSAADDPQVAHLEILRGLRDSKHF